MCTQVCNWHAHEFDGRVEFHEPMPMLDGALRASCGMQTGFRRGMTPAERASVLYEYPDPRWGRIRPELIRNAGKYRYIVLEP